MCKYIFSPELYFISPLPLTHLKNICTDGGLVKDISSYTKDMMVRRILLERYIVLTDQNLFDRVANTKARLFLRLKESVLIYTLERQTGDKDFIEKMYSVTDLLHKEGTIDLEVKQLIRRGDNSALQLLRTVQNRRMLASFLSSFNET